MGIDSPRGPMQTARAGEFATCHDASRGGAEGIEKRALTIVQGNRRPTSVVNKRIVNLRVKGRGHPGTLGTVSFEFVVGMFPALYGRAQFTRECAG